MGKQLRRRDFLKAAGPAVIVGAELAGAPYISALAAGPTAENNKSPRLFVGCCAYSYRKPLEAKKMTMEDFIRTGVDLRVDGVDMTAYWFKSTDPAYLERNCCQPSSRGEESSDQTLCTRTRLDGPCSRIRSRRNSPRRIAS